MFDSAHVIWIERKRGCLLLGTPLYVEGLVGHARLLLRMLWAAKKDKLVELIVMYRVPYV
jgi:hypothetical protein